MNQINDPRLLPCPFCGEDAAIWYYPIDGLRNHESYYVACTNDNCGCELEHPGGYRTLEEALEKWNRRARMNSERCSQCKHFIIANAGEGKIYGCDRSKCVFEPTTKNDLGVDCISRDDVWDVMQELWGTSGELMDRLMALPSVTPQEPKTGKWISTETKGVRYAFWCRYKCSLCGGLSDHTNFCPNCGAKMESEDKE